MNAISKLIAVVIIVSVAVSISIGFAVWIASTTVDLTNKIVKITFYEALYAVKTVLLYVENTGTVSSTVDAVYVDNLQGYIAWAWDTTSNKYIGRGTVTLEPGHIVILGLKTAKSQLAPGMLIEFKLHTGSGYTFYRTIELDSHPALNYIRKGYINIWDYDEKHMFAVYRDYYSLYDNGTIDSVPRLSLRRRDAGAARWFHVEFNMWYMFLNLKHDSSIIYEIAFTNRRSWAFLDLLASKDGYLSFYISPLDETVKTNKKMTDPHHISVDLRVPAARKVEITLSIDGDIVYRKNTSKLYRWWIGNQCFGVWDEASISELYLDQINETIIWRNNTNMTVYQDFDNLTTNYFTDYRIQKTGSPQKITGYPIEFYNGIIGVAMDSYNI